MKGITVSSLLADLLNDYQSTMQDLSVELFIAEQRIEVEGHSLTTITEYNRICLAIADLAKHNGDDESYTIALRKVYLYMSDLLAVMPGSDTNCFVYAAARDSMTLLYNFYLHSEQPEYAEYFHSHFTRMTMFAK